MVEWWRVFRQDRRDRLALLRPANGCWPVTISVQHRAQAEDVAPAVEWFIPNLLGRHVRHRAGNPALERHHAGEGCGVSVSGLSAARDAEVEHLRLTARGQHDVVRFDVPMDDAAVVRVAQRIGHLCRDGERLCGRQRAARKRCGECLALDGLHDDEGAALGFADIVDRADVGMIERRRRACLLTADAVADARRTNRVRPPGT